MFASKVIKPFQDLVKTQVALIRFGHVKERGPTRRGVNSELYLTALPVGSFGLELSQIGENALFDGQDVATAIRQIIQLIEATAKGEEPFENESENVPKRNLTNLRNFLEVIASEHSILRIESGDLGIEIPEANVTEAFERVNATTSEDEKISITGTLRGFLLDSGLFQIVDEEGISISGFIGEELNEEEIIAYDREFLNRVCQIHLCTYTTTFKTGKRKVSYELLGISSPK